MKLLKRTHWILTLVCGLTALCLANTASADCSVIPPDSFDRRAYLGSTTSPFLTPGLTTDIKIVSAVCNHDLRSAAPDFQVAGVDQPADAFVITIAFTPAAGPRPLLILAADPTLCGSDPNCTVDTTTDREIALIPLPGGQVERRLRFRFPDLPPALGPARLGVKLASDPNPVALALRTDSCSGASDSFAACIDLFYRLDGSCRTTLADVDQPFTGLVAIPKTNFTSLCTAGCDDVSTGPTTSTLPITVDRDGNAIFAMIYADQLVRSDRGDGLIEPRPRRLSLSIEDAANNGFADDGGGAVYAGKPSSFTFEGFPLSPPFNPFVDPTVPAGDVGIWGMADAEATVHFLPRRACSNKPARACLGDSDCDTGTCSQAEFSFAQVTTPIALPIASAEAQQAVELNSWLDGSLADSAVVLTEEESLRGAPINGDGALDDFVVELLDRGTGLLKLLRQPFEGRGVTRVGVVEGDRDFVLPAVAAEGRRIAFLESELGEELAGSPTMSTSPELIAADVNGNSRLDQNLRIFELPSDPSVAAAVSLLPDDLHLSVLADLRFGSGESLVLSQGKLFFAYSPRGQQPHGYQLVSQSTSGVPGNFAAGESDLSSDGRYLAFASGADNLFAPGGAQGALVAQTSDGTLIRALTGPGGEFPVISNGQSIFAYEASKLAKGAKPSRANFELEICAPAAGEPDLEMLLNLQETGPNASIEFGDACESCFPGSNRVEFDRGLGKGRSQIYTLVFDDDSVPTAEIGASIVAQGNAEHVAIRGPSCRGARLQGGIARIYLRDTQTGSTELVSVSDRSSCSEMPSAANEPSGNPRVTPSGQQIFFDTTAGLVASDADGGASDVYVYDRSICQAQNLSSGLVGESRKPTSADAADIVAFESGATPNITLLDRNTGQFTDLGPGRSPDLSADGTQLVFTDTVAGVSQVFLVDLAGGTAPVAVSVVDGLGGGFLAAGGGEPSVSNTGDTAFSSPLGGPDPSVLVRDPANGDTALASSDPEGRAICTTSPCGAFAPSISDDGRSVAFVLRGLAPFDEIFVKNLVTGSLTALTRSAGADGDSLEPRLGTSGDFVALTSSASQLGGAAGSGDPSIFLEGPADPSAAAGPFLGVIDLQTCLAGTCIPTLTNEPIERGAVFEGAAAVVGSPVRLVELNAGVPSVRSFVREGRDVALSDQFVCALATQDASGNPGSFAACASRTASTLTDLTVANVPLSAERIGLCGSRAMVLSPGGSLYQADLATGFDASFVQAAEDFELGEDVDLDGNGTFDSCLVAFRTLELDLGGTAATVGNRDLDTDDLAMYLLDAGGNVTDCASSATDCPGQACQQFNYQVGLESVLFIVDEFDENFGFTPAQDVCSPGSDVNSDGLCDESVRRCTSAGSLTEGTSLGLAGNVFSGGSFPDGENTVTLAGFCGTDPMNVRVGQLCLDDDDCLSMPGETCQGGFVVLSALADTDLDEIPDVFDNCPLVPNPDQTNSDLTDPALQADRFGDACDTLTCGDGILQSAETCDDGASNGTPGSSCSSSCGCAVNFDVIELPEAGGVGPTPFILQGNAASDGSGCVNFATQAVGGTAAKSIEAQSLRISANVPTSLCPTTGAATIHDLSDPGVYTAHLEDRNGDGITDLYIEVVTPDIGATSQTTELYLTGRFSADSASPGACFQSVAPVDYSGH